MASFSVPAAGVHSLHARAEQPHPEHVERLTPHVLGSHVDHALEAEQGAGRGAGDAVLARSGFRDDAPLPHPDREQRLAEGVVDLVCPCMGEVLSLEQDTRAPGRGAEPSGLPQRRRSPDVIAQEPIELGRERDVRPCREVLALERLDRRNERLGHESTAEGPEIAARVGIAPSEPVDAHATALTAATKAASLS